MANYANAKATIAANIYTNHRGEVTAESVKTAANEIVDTLIAGGYLYAGVAKLTPTQTNPGSPDANVFYIATEPGTYTNFVGAGGALVVNDGEVAILKYNGAWSKEVTGAATAAQVTELGQDMRTIPIFDVSAYNNDKTYPEFGQAVINDIPISERRSGMIIKFRRHIDGEQAFNDVYLHFLYTLPYSNTTTGNSRFSDIYNWAAIKDTIGNYVHDKNIALGKTVKEAIDVVHRKIDGIVTYNLPVLTKDVGRLICRIDANIGKLFKIEVVSNTATIGGTGNFTIHTNFGYDSFPSTQGASKQFSFSGDVEYLEFYVRPNDGVTVEGDVVLKVTNYNGSSIKEILEDGIYINSGTTTVTQGSAATFFNSDVAIPKGSVIKLEVVSGYPDIIKEPRYNINNTGNVLADGPVTLIEAVEDVTHIMYGVSSSRVVASGDVVTRISVLSVKDDIAEVKKKIGVLGTSVSSLDERVEALEEGADTSPYSQYIDAVAQKVFDEISETSETNEEKAIFVHITDTHGGGIRSSYGMTLDRTRLHMNMVGKVAKAVNAKFVIHTGDAIDGYDTTSEPTPDSYMALVRGYSEDIPLIFSEGNYSHDFGKPNEKLVRGQVQSYFGRGKKWLEDNVQYNSTDGVKSYFYFDDEKTKIRYIILDAQDAIREGWHPTGGRNAYGFSQEQRTFVSDALDDALSNNLSVFFFAHMPPTANLFPNITGEDASYGIETDGHGDLLIAEIKSFTDAGGVVLGYSFGHNHFDNQYYDSVTKIPYIGLVCDVPSKLVRDSINWGTISAWDRSLDDVTQFAFDVYVISPVSKKVKMFRFGAGIDRTYTLPTNP